MAINQDRQEPTAAYSANAGCGCVIEWTSGPEAFPQNVSVRHVCQAAQLLSLQRRGELAGRVVEAARRLDDGFMAINKKNGWGRVEIADMARLGAALKQYDEAMRGEGEGA